MKMLCLNFKLALIDLLNHYNVSLQFFHVDDSSFESVCKNVTQKRFNFIQQLIQAKTL